MQQITTTHMPSSVGYYLSPPKLLIITATKIVADFVKFTQQFHIAPVASGPAIPYKLLLNLK